MTDLTYSLSPPVVSTSPATRIYIGGLEYKLVGPRFVKPPLAHTMKLVWNWVLPAARAAKNVMFAQFPAVVDTTSNAMLKAAANALMSSIASSNLAQNLGNTNTLASVTASDNSGLSNNTQNSDHAPISGGGLGSQLAPQIAVVISWNVGATWKGGKARTYIPGLTGHWQPTTGDSQLDHNLCLSLQESALSLILAFSEAPVGTGLGTLGTISYQAHHAALPTPIFRPYENATVHERMDSQRRRSGKEATFGSEP